MMLGLLFLVVHVTGVDPTWKWSNAVKIVEKHEFYGNNEVITKPKDSWQTLFGVQYHDANLKMLKDCLFYRVPGEESGFLKLKTVEASKSCEEFIFQPGDQEWKDLKGLQYSIEDNYLNLSMTNQKYEVETWNVPLFNFFEHPEPKNLMSSAEYRSPKMIYLAPYKGKQDSKPKKAALLTDKSLCHRVTDDCKEVSPSVCSQCPHGWYEVPNGCPSGPKYCGSIICGLKNKPACRRGMKYQRSEEPFKCRDNHSFAYCAKGLILQCQGQLPYCV